MTITSRLSAKLVTSSALLLALSAAGPECRADFVYFDGSTSTDFRIATNWTPENAPGSNLVDIYGIDDGLSSTLSGGANVAVNGLRVGSAAKEHTNSVTQFGRLTMTGGSLEVIGVNTLAVGRERQNDRIGADYNKDSVVEGGDFLLWQRDLGSMSALAADGDGSGKIDGPDLDVWKAGYGKVVKGGEVILTGTSTLKANGALIGERTKGLLSIGPDAVVDIRIWDTVVTPNQFGGTEDMRVGGYGPAYDDFGGEPGLDGQGLVDVRGALNAKDLYVSEHGGKGEIRVAGGTVNLNGALFMSFCAGCVPNTTPANKALLARQSSKVSIIGSTGTFLVGLDPDPTVLDPMPGNRDISSNFPLTATFSFTADAGGVTPITVVDNGAELSGAANIAGTNLELNLDAYTATTPLPLIDAKSGNLLGRFGTVTFLGRRRATVNYDELNGNVFLNNFQNVAAAATPLLAGSIVPEPSGLVLTLTLGLLLSSSTSRARRQTARHWGCQWLTFRA